MANFAIRVELRGDPSADKYDELHTLMGKKGFKQTIAGVDLQGNSKTFNLPHAVYYGSSTDSCAAVADSVAKAIRSQIQTNIIVFTVQAEAWAIR
jgi:uncharacterized protein involved in propanediol utilization